MTATRPDVLEALSEREVNENADPDTQMREVVGWHLGDESWWNLIKAWMTDVGYRQETDR